MAGGYFKINELRASTSTENNRRESIENVASTERSKVARPIVSWSVVGLKRHDIAEKTIHYIHLNHMTEKPKIVNAETEEYLKKADFNFMVDIKTLMNKTSVDPKMVQRKKNVY